MASDYDIIKHQVEPIFKGAKGDYLAIEKSAKGILRTIEDGVGACGDEGPVAGALHAFGASTVGTLREALGLASRVITAGYNATNAYIEADFHMTGNVRRALDVGITAPWEHKQ
jgi:hypothetical protein